MAPESKETQLGYKYVDGIAQKYNSDVDILTAKTKDF